MSWDNVLNTAVGGAVTIGVLDRTTARHRSPSSRPHRRVARRNESSLWMKFPSRRKAVEGAEYLKRRTHQEVRVRKMPNRRSWGVYAH